MIITLAVGHVWMSVSQRVGIALGRSQVYKIQSAIGSEGHFVSCAASGYLEVRLQP